MSKQHLYKTKTEWTGNLGSGTSGYANYEREHLISVKGKEPIFASSDPAFRGDGSKMNPEELFVSSLSSCHMLWYLHLCADAGIIVKSYTDEAIGMMEENQHGGGQFVRITLNPKVVISDNKMIEKANSLHAEAHKKCFIANSCNFPVIHLPDCLVEENFAISS